MAVDDLWYLRQRDDGGDRVPSKRHGRGKRWRVRYADDGGERVERLFDRKAEAERFDAGVRTDVARGLYVDPVAGQVTVTEYAEQWRTAQLHRHATTGAIERAFRLHINPVLGHRPLASVRSSAVQAWVKGLDLAPGSTRVVYGYLAAMFRSAARDRAIAVSPCVDIRLPEVITSDHPTLTPEQVHTLAETLPSRYRALVYLGAGCGLRISEALGLEVSSVTPFLAREVRVSQQLLYPAGSAPHLGPPKTKTSHRVVELPQVAANALSEHLRLHPPQPQTLTDATDPRKVSERPVSLLFTDDKGRPLRSSAWGVLWGPAARAAKLPPRTGYHALRHYFATLLIFGGASVKTVQLALGHSSPMITLNTYVGLWPDQIDRTRTLVDDALGTSGHIAATSEAN
jgi:integrase